MESAVADLAGRARWLRPLAYAAGTVAVVFDGVLLLIRHWQLTLLQILPAAWVWGMSWNLRNHMLADPRVSTMVSIVIAVGVLIATQVAYWCNATFGYTMVQGATPDIGAAFAEARPHWRLVGGLALLTGGLQASIALAIPHVHTRWLWLGLLVMFTLQIYLFIAVPSWLLGVRKTGSRQERTIQSLTTGRVEWRGSDAWVPAQPHRMAAVGNRRVLDRCRSRLNWRGAPCHRKFLRAGGEAVSAIAAGIAGVSSKCLGRPRRVAGAEEPSRCL